MRLPRIRLTLLALLSITLATPLSLNLTPLSRVPQVLAQTPDARKAEADRLLQQGRQQHQTRQFEAAIKSWERALILYREIKYHSGEQKALEELLDAFLQRVTELIESRHQLSVARNQEEELTRLRQKITEYQQQLSVISRQALQDDLQDFEEELTGIRQEVEEYKKQKIQELEALQSWARTASDRKAAAERLFNAGHWAIKIGISSSRQEEPFLQKGLQLYQQALTIYQEIKDSQGEAEALFALGMVHDSYLRDPNTAIEYFKQLLTLYQKLRDRTAEGRALNHLGIAYHDLSLLTGGDYVQAIQYSQQSLIIARELKDRQGEERALLNLGTAYTHQGDYAQAVEYLQPLLVIYQESKDIRSSKKTLSSLAKAYYYLDDHGKAIQFLQQLLAMHQESKDDEVGEGNTLLALGLSLYKSGNLKAAETTLLDAFKIWEFLQTDFGINQEQFKLNYFDMQALTSNLLQQVLIAQNKTETALEVAEQGRARVLYSSLEYNVDPVGTKERFERQSPPTPEENLLPSQPNESLYTRIIRQSDRILRRSPIPESFTLQQLKQIAKAQNSTIVEYSIIRDNNIYQEQNQRNDRESELYIWVIQPTGEIAFRKVDIKSLNTPLHNLVASSRKAIGVRGRATAEIIYEPGTDEKQRLQELHNVLIRPIADLLPTDPNAHVIFIPQQELFLVPFAALQDEQDKYLIEKHTILTAPSIQVLELTRQKRERLGMQGVAPLQGRNTLIAGNPTMPSISLKVGEPPQKLSSLPGAEREALEIAKVFNTQALLGSQATETTIKSQLPKADIIHLATHGLLDYGQLQGQFRQGVPGAIALAPDGTEDGLLTSDEILGLQLNASLVVLSACDTGQGDIRSDGIIGLSRSFISSGTPSIIVSLWSVPDAPTAELMTEFYLQLQQNPDKAQALRQAMLSIMKQRLHPKDWAAFTLIGEAF